MFFYIAPIQGITDSCFRNIYSEHFKGIDAAVAPFVSAQPREAAGLKLLRDLLPENNSGMPIIPQILGNSSVFIADTVNALNDLGYNESNWNLGCPYPMITKKNRGAGLLRNSEALDKILEGIFSRISSGFSIKTRIGFENPDEILELIKVFNRYPLSEIIIHPRVARQMYSGRASVDVFREIMNLSDHQLVYNGDICSVDVFREISSKLAGINRWMIGRAAISNPFLPEMIKNGEGFPEDAPERFFRFHDALYDSFRQKFHGPAHLLDRMKAFWRYFHLSFSNGRDIQKRINKIRTEADYLEAVNSLKSKEPNLVEIKSPLMMDL